MLDGDDDVGDLADPDVEPRTWTRTVRDALLTVVLVVAVVQGFGWIRAPDLPEQAPGFVLTDLDGERVALEDFRGRTVVLNFWATWCGPCRIEAPSFSTFAQNNPDITVLGISADRQVGPVKRAVEDMGLGYPVLMADTDVLADYGITTYPTTVVVGPDGTVRTAHTGILLRPQLWLMTTLTGG